MKDSSDQEFKLPESKGEKRHKGEDAENKDLNSEVEDC